VQDVHGRLARVFVLGEDGAFEHGNDRLAQYPLMAADDGIRSVTSAGGGDPFQQFMTQGFQGNLCMPYDASNLPGVVTCPERSGLAQLVTRPSPQAPI